MRQYVFHIHQGSSSTNTPVDLPNDGAAWREAAEVCSNLILDIVPRLKNGPEWRLEVMDDTGAVLHLFRVTAETFG
jgi:hypothetical protein